ncbi:MAG: hypothetical protein V4472_24885 [Pseudomonadota bacterium]
MIAALSDWPYAAGGAIVGLVLLGLVGTVIDIWIERRDARLLGTDPTKWLGAHRGIAKVADALASGGYSLLPKGRRRDGPNGGRR